MGATAAPASEVQDTLAEALEASDDPGKIAEEDAKAAEAEAKTGDEKPAEETPAPKPVPDKKDDLLSIEEQNKELRQILRIQKRDMAVMKSKLERVEKRSIEATKKVAEEVDDEAALFGSPSKKAEDSKPAAPESEQLSAIEIIQAELAAVARIKGPVLETLLEVLEASPKYEDIRDVCSQSNFDDMFEVIGEAVAAKEGKDASVAALEAETAVWKMPNPYKYMYGLIKQYHPKYAGRHQDKKEDAAEASKDKVRKPAEAPSSIADKAGKTTPSNAWTAARIDEMPESELHKVPDEIYQKYLRNELD